MTTISDDQAWMPGVKRLVIPGRTIPHDPTMVLLHTNGAGPSTPENLYSFIMNQIAVGDPNGVTKPHFDIGLDGEIVQMIPINRKGATCYHAEPWTIGIETADHGVGVDSEPWTPAQVASLTGVVAWISATAGIPLTRPASWQGHGVEGHCASNLIPGDARGFKAPNTSKYAGKICPGHARLAQIDGILAAAEGELHPQIPTPPPSPAPTPLEDDMAYLLDCADKVARPGVIFVDGGKPVALKDTNELGAIQRTLNPVVKTAPTADDFDIVATVISR